MVERCRVLIPSCGSECKRALARCGAFVVLEIGIKSIAACCCVGTWILCLGHSDCSVACVEDCGLWITCGLTTCTKLDLTRSGDLAI